MIIKHLQFFKLNIYFNVYYVLYNITIYKIKTFLKEDKKKRQVYTFPRTKDLTLKTSANFVIVITYRLI